MPRVQLESLYGVAWIPFHRNFGRFRDVKFQAIEDLDYLGYTPHYFGLLTLFLRGKGALTEVFRNDGADGVTLSQQANFRLGKIGNGIAYMITGYWAPYAWMRYVYRAYTNQRVIVEITGSHIPSQTFYLGY